MATKKQTVTKLVPLNQPLTDGHGSLELFLYRGEAAIILDGAFIIRRSQLYRKFTPTCKVGDKVELT